jgi:hypothetical protein
MRSVRKKKVTAGKRGGTKRRDMRWITPDGQEWDSKYEYEVYKAGIDAKLPIRRTVKGKGNSTESDTLLYWHPNRSGSCFACGSTETGSTRSYTADLFCNTSLHSAKSGNKDNHGAGLSGYYVDAKGYLRPNKRALLRSLVKARKDIDLRILLQRDFPVSKVSRASDWIRKYLKIKFAIWNGKWPTEWNG